ncbi:MAG TPA: preprotein translocase subunit SecG [Desulfosporosinus sp.]|nr:preprotein translocase subunit SecG [Desulfosporosinus sp.]
MIIAVVVLLTLCCLGLIATVLLQSGRSAGLSGAITGASESVFGKKKGMDAVLGKLTTVLATLFLLSCLGLAMLEK